MEPFRHDRKSPELQSGVLTISTTVPIGVGEVGFEPTKPKRSIYSAVQLSNVAALPRSTIVPITTPDSNRHVLSFTQGVRFDARPRVTSSRRVSTWISHFLLCLPLSPVAKGTIVYQRTLICNIFPIMSLYCLNLQKKIRSFFKDLNSCIFQRLYIEF